MVSSEGENHGGGRCSQVPWEVAADRRSRKMGGGAASLKQ